MKRRALMRAKLFISGILVLSICAIGADLPDPDGKPADMSKPVQVFLIMGQSNALGFGAVSGADGSLENACKNSGLYPYMVDADGNWTVRQDVRNVRVMNFKDHVNDWMSASGQKSIGVEMGAGHYLGNLLDAPVMMLKSCIGNRSLGWDLLPPGSEPYDFDGKTEPGYRGTPENPKGTGEKPDAGWYAGKQYDDDVGSAKQVLDNLEKYYPGAKGYEVAGVFWWQGDKDMRNPAHVSRYEQNLEQFMKAIRKDFDAPNAKFVFASLGQTKKGDSSGHGKILDAMESVAKKHADAGFVYTQPLSKGGSSSGHYNKNAETYMNVGEGMGKVMVDLLKKSGAGSSSRPAATSASTPAAGGASAPKEDIHAMRTWTDARWRKLQAKLVGIEGDSVKLEKPDGNVITIKKVHLSFKDQKLIQSAE